MTAFSKRPRWRTAARVALFMFLCALILAIAAPYVPRLFHSGGDLAIGLVAAIGTFAITAVFVRWEGLSLADVGAASGWRSPLKAATGFAIGLALVFVWAVLSISVSHVRWVRSSPAGAGSTVTALVTYLILAAREELAFRGYPLRRLDSEFGLWPALLALAAVFVLEHRLGGYPWSDAIFGSGMGALLFGMAAIATGGLALPIGLHAAWNFGQWLIGMKGAAGFWRPVVVSANAEQVHFAETTIYVLLMSAATLAFWMRYRRTKLVT